MQTSNPAFSAESFVRARGAAVGPDAMTIQGTISKTGILIACALVPAVTIYGNPAAMGYTMIGAIAGMVFAFATIFVPRWAPVTAPLYAVAEGVFLGGISAVFEARYPGIVTPALLSTFGVLICMLAAYRTGLVRATEKFKLGVIAATGAIALVYLVSIVLNLFHVAVPLIYSSGPIGIAFSVIVVGIAALNLVLDFDLVERGAASGMPKYMEWYSAFALMVTLVWLYLRSCGCCRSCASVDPPIQAIQPCRVRACTHVTPRRKKPRGCKHPPYQMFPQQKLLMKASARAVRRRLRRSPPAASGSRRRAWH